MITHELMEIKRQPYFTDIFMAINTCKAKGHFQQVVYSVHGNMLTQICWDCPVIRVCHD